MSRLLLLYDTKEKDLARDVADLLGELRATVVMIPLAPNLGRTLQAKEEDFFADADGAVFLVTPGAERDGRKVPSPSVADEMGRAKERFKAAPGRVAYLVDSQCHVQAVDQASYIQFDRTSVRSTVEAITLLIRELKAVGLVLKPEIPQRETPGIDIAALAKNTPPQLKRICADLSNQPSGAMTYQEFLTYLRQALELSQQEANFAIRDLQVNGLVTYNQPRPPLSDGFFALSNIGWELVRHEMAERSERLRAAMQILLEKQRKARSDT